MTKEEFSTRVMGMERLLFCIARTALPGPQDCADAIQEAVLRSWMALGTLRVRISWRGLSSAFYEIIAIQSERSGAKSRWRSFRRQRTSRKKAR